MKNLTQQTRKSQAYPSPQLIKHMMNCFKTHGPRRVALFLFYFEQEKFKNSTG